MLLRKEELETILKSRNYKDDIIIGWWVHPSGKAFCINNNEFGNILKIVRSNCNYRTNGKPYISQDRDFNSEFDGAIFHNDEIYLLTLGTYRPSEEQYEELRNK